MSRIVQSLDRLQKDRRHLPNPQASEDNEGKDSLFSRIGILLWLGASISATVFSYHLGVKQGVQAVKAESPKQWVNYLSDLVPTTTMAKRSESSLQLAKELAAAKAKTGNPEVKVSSAASMPTPEKAVKAQPETPKKQGFTIQVITYVSDRLAKEEVDRLAQKGQKAFVVPSGKYFQVCLDLFDNKKLAAKKLTQLRTEPAYKAAYPGAYVKFLKQ